MLLSCLSINTKESLGFFVGFANLCVKIIFLMKMKKAPLSLGALNVENVVLESPVDSRKYHHCIPRDCFSGVKTKFSWYAKFDD